MSPGDESDGKGQARIMFDENAVRIMEVDGKAIVRGETPDVAMQVGGADDLAVSPRAPWEMSRREFWKENPHDIKPNSDPISRGREIDALPDSAPIWVFHATDDATAAAMLRDGIQQKTKPVSLGRERLGRKEYAEFGPGAGLGAGVYVGATPVSVEGYGRHIVAIRTTKGQLGVPPEGARLNKTLGLAVADSDAEILGDVSKNDIFDMAGIDRYSTAHKAFVQRAVNEGRPVPRAVLDEYPDLKKGAK